MIFKFEPIYQTRVWGGTMFSDILGRKINYSEPIGESWDLVDRNENQSVLVNTKLRGKTIRELIEADTLGMMGPHWKKEMAFPVLVKWLDCSDRLSLQVHPPKEIASEFNAEPKTENWYVAHAEKGAGLYAGLKKGTSRQMFENALKHNAAESLCHRINSMKNDSLLLKSGRIHAIDAGNLILEIQQNSNSTFRVYDWGRTGLDGKPRELHIEQSLKCIDFEDFEPEAIHSCNDVQVQILADEEHFRIRKFNCNQAQVLKIKESNVNCTLVHVVEGSLQVCGETLVAGEHGLSPFAHDCVVANDCTTRFLVTDKFA